MSAYPSRKRKRPAPKRDAQISDILRLVPRGTFRKVGGILGTVGGTKLGGPIGGMVGGSLGSLAGGAVSAVTGFGDYYGITGKNMSVPRVFNRSKRHGVAIRHEEYLGDIVTSATPGAFQIQGFNINPGLGVTFPWLEQIATNFEEYILEGCLFTYKSMSCDALNSTNTALGTVIMATNYNAGNPLFASKAEMESYEFASSCKPSMSMVHPVECNPHQNPISELYIRNGTVPSGQDIRLYDLGRFQIATTGFQGASVSIGELWISYQVCLLKPKMFNGLGLDTGYWNMTSSTGILAASAPLGTNQSVSSSSSLAITSNQTTLTFPPTSYPQTYAVSFYWSGNTAATWVPPALTYTNCTGSVTPAAAPQSGLAGTTLAKLTTFVVTNGLYQTSTVVVGTGGTIPTNGPVVNVQVYQLPNGAN